MPGNLRAISAERERNNSVWPAHSPNILVFMDLISSDLSCSLEQAGILLIINNAFCSGGQGGNGAVPFLW